MRELISDIVILCGCGALVYGALLISSAAAWIVGGLLLILIGIFFGMGGRK